jgi:hypothetical protein
LHAVAPHPYGAHAVVVWVHMPVPLQAPGAFVWSPAEHDAVPQVVPMGQSRQAPPWQCPSVPQLEGDVARQIIRGSKTPSFALAQVPSLPPVRAPAHAWQAPAQAELQQNPSTQNVLAHSAPTEHRAPFG